MLENIYTKFQLSGTVQEVTEYGSGHIHETYAIRIQEQELDDYILQKINHNIFSPVDKLMNNIELVTDHLIHKIKVVDSKLEVLKLVYTNDNKSFYLDEDGNYWRIFIFIKDSKSYDLVSKKEQAYEGGAAYGEFQSLLSDLNTENLYEILPNFHNIEFRLKQLENAKRADKVKRVAKSIEELDFIQEYKEQMLTILNWGKEGLIPLRTTHNDTKFNNVLLDQNDKALCVIDLDTIMPGYVAYDFGDAIRTIVNTANEDEKQLNKIQLNMPLLKAFSEGFINKVGKNLNNYEVDSLAYGCLLLPYIMGVRFLTDYLDGDNYYKIHFPEHNLQRAKAQLYLTKRLLENFSDIQQIIKAAHQTTFEKS